MHQKGRSAVRSARLQARGVTIVALLTLSVVGSSFGQTTGDANCDGRVDAGDVRDIIPVVFGNSSLVCSSGEANADGRVSAADIPATLRVINRPLPTGAQISYLGLAGSNGTPLSPLGTIGDTPVFFRNSGSGFRLVIEGSAGINRVSPGKNTFDRDPLNPARRPDVHIGCTKPLGDGSLAICESGVPALAPPHFTGTQRTADTLNDLACNFDVITSSRFACTNDRFQNPNFLGPSSEVQFCLQVTQRVEFAAGDTLCTIQLRDQGGTLGPPKALIIRVDSGPVPPTFTATLAATLTPTPTPRPSLTPTRTASRTPTSTKAVPTENATSTPTRVTPAATSTISVPTPTTPGAPSATPTRVPPDATPTGTPTRTHTRTPTRSHTPTLSPTRTVSATPSASRSPTRTSTPSSPQGPIVTYFGLARADEVVIPPSGMTPGGIAIYSRPFGNGFRIVVEGAPGPSFENPGSSSYSFGSFAFADLQIQTTRALGNGSPAVCDRDGSNAGGIPAINPPNFQQTQMILDAVNDFSCRFVDGGDAFRGRTNTMDSCVQNPPDSGTFGFIAPGTKVQFCGLVDLAIKFPPGDTTLTVRLRDIAGNVGVSRQIIVRIAG